MYTDLSDEIAEFYKGYNGSCFFIEEDSYRCDCEITRVRNWKLMKEYAANANISVFDAHDRDYVYYCHCCGQDMDYANLKGEMYCSIECESAIEVDGYKCNFYNCLICNEEREETPPFLDNMKKFYYLTGCRSNMDYNMSIYGFVHYRRILMNALQYNMTMQEARSYINTARRPEIRPMEHLPELSRDDQFDLETYARDYGVTLAEAYAAQHKCQYCFTEVVPKTFGPGHQFCSLWCDVCYDVKPESDRCDYCQGANEYCPACDGEVHYLKQEVLRREELNTVVAAAFAFDELKIYNQVYDSLFDLSEYLF
jgi:hypothetical protein